MTIEEALEAYKEKFGYYDLALFHMSDEAAIKAVEKCLKTGKPIKYGQDEII